ncbi:MAG: arginase [Trueperaceae bacterium]|nr:arginase [Trueperaceae bacterium]
MATLAVLGVPMDLGAGRRGVDMGPSALRLAGLETTLRDLGHDVVDHGNIDVPVPEALDPRVRPRYLVEIAATCRRTVEALRALPEETVPIVLGGDHSVSMGSIAGVHRRGRTGVLWIDAHGDLNTPTTSPSGNVHGMPLAHLLGEGDARLLATWGGGARIAADDVVLLGVRSLDDGERAAVHARGLHVRTMSDIDRRGMAAVAEEALALLSHVDALHVSFDADALDPTVAPGVGTPVPGGLSYREAHLLMEILAESGLVTSVDLVEINPVLDVSNRSARVLVEMAASLFGRRVL